MELGKRFCFDRIFIQGDAINVTGAVLGDIHNIPWFIHSVTLEIRDLINAFAHVKFQSVPKSTNNMAHVVPICNASQCK